MKYQIIATIILCFCILTEIAYGNPFSCKIKLKEETSPEKPVEEVTYKGYAIRDDRRFAVIQYQNEQYALKSGDRLIDFLILRITPEYVVIKHGKTVFRTEIESDENPP